VGSRWSLGEFCPLPWLDSCGGGPARPCTFHGSLISGLRGPPGHMLRARALRRVPVLRSLGLLFRVCAVIRLGWVLGRFRRTQNSLLVGRGRCVGGWPRSESRESVRDGCPLYASGWACWCAMGALDFSCVTRVGISFRVSVAIRRVLPFYPLIHPGRAEMLSTRRLHAEWRFGRCWAAGALAGPVGLIRSGLESGFVFLVCRL